VLDLVDCFGVAAGSPAQVFLPTAVPRRVGVDGEVPGRTWPYGGCRRCSPGPQFCWLEGLSTVVWERRVLRAGQKRTRRTSLSWWAWVPVSHVVTPERWQVGPG